MLASARSPLLSCHDALATLAYLRASGRSATCRLELRDSAVVQEWQVA